MGENLKKKCNYLTSNAYMDCLDLFGKTVGNQHSILNYKEEPYSPSSPGNPMV